MGKHPFFLIISASLDFYNWPVLPHELIVSHQMNGNHV